MFCSDVLQVDNEILLLMIKLKFLFVISIATSALELKNGIPEIKEKLLKTYLVRLLFLLIVTIDCAASGTVALG